MPEPRPGLAPLAPTPALQSRAGPPLSACVPAAGAQRGGLGRCGGGAWMQILPHPLPELGRGEFEYGLSKPVINDLPSWRLCVGMGPGCGGQHPGSGSALAVPRSHRGWRTRGGESLLGGRNPPRCGPLSPQGQGSVRPALPTAGPGAPGLGRIPAASVSILTQLLPLLLRLLWSVDQSPSR